MDHAAAHQIDLALTEDLDDDGENDIDKGAVLWLSLVVVETVAELVGERDLGLPDMLGCAELRRSVHGQGGYSHVSVLARRAARASVGTTGPLMGPVEGDMPGGLVEDGGRGAAPSLGEAAMSTVEHFGRSTAASWRLRAAEGGLAKLPSKTCWDP
jgi:hypothetical protein